MTDSNIQIRGHCQHCGRQQAVQRGRMSKHGYEVKGHGQGGWFEGVCHGDQHVPLEQERKHADAMMAAVTSDVANLRQRRLDLLAGKWGPSSVQGHYNAAKREYDRIPFSEAPAYKQREAIESTAWQLEARANSGESWVKGMAKLADEVHGKPLLEVPRDEGPEPILYGEKRTLPRGTCQVTSVYRGKVSWSGADGKRGSMSTRMWRTFPKAT